MNMLDKIEFINISDNPIIKEINNKILKDNFYVENIKDHKAEVEIDVIDNINLDSLHKYNAAKQNLRLRANNCKIIICKINYLIF